MVEPKLVVVIMLLVIGICFWLFWPKYESSSSRPTKWIRMRLKKLPFCHQLFVGVNYNHHFWENGVWRVANSDARFLVIVKKDDRVIGMIGFDLTSRSLLVRQLQGIRGLNVKGIDLAAYLLECAEKIAQILHLEVVKVQLACHNLYYDLSDEHPLYPRLFSHRKRLARIYDETPRSRGYELSVDMRWHEKHVI